MALLYPFFLCKVLQNFTRRLNGTQHELEQKALYLTGHEAKLDSDLEKHRGKLQELSTKLQAEHLSNEDVDKRIDGAFGYPPAEVPGCSRDWENESSDS